MNITLTNEEKSRLLSLIIDEYGISLSHEEFSDQVGMMFENISGFENINDNTFQLILEELWNQYTEGEQTMFGKESKTPETKPKTPVKTASPKSEKTPNTTKSKDQDNNTLVMKSITEARKLIDAGKSKAEVARTVFPSMKGLSRKEVVQVFMEGVGLTKAGASTYFYNISKKINS